MGDGYLRKLLVVGATAILRRVADTQTRIANWIRSLLERKASRLVSVANIAWQVIDKCPRGGQQNRSDRMGALGKRRNLSSRINSEQRCIVYAAH